MLILGGASRPGCRPLLRLCRWGLTAIRLNDQSQVVAKDVAEFQESFLEALAIVLAVSFLSLGWRTGLVVAISVPLVLAGTLVGMKLLGIDLQRISLGAMIIALGLLVDDAIIAVETMMVKLEQGWDRMRAGSFAYTSTAFPMLTGTLVTAAGYLPVGLAQSSTGEYTRDIFRVVGLALVLSWIVAVVFVPYLGSILLPEVAHKAGNAEHAVYDTRFTERCAGRWAGASRAVVGDRRDGRGVRGVSGWIYQGAAAVFSVFRPTGSVGGSAAAEGGSFAATAASVRQVEDILRDQKGIRSWVAYTGVGTPRFFLAFSPQLQTPNFAQFVINTDSVPAREALLNRLTKAVQAGDFADVRIRPSRLELGPPVGYPVQFRVTGPDPSVLRRIAGQVAR